MEQRSPPNMALIFQEMMTIDRSVMRQPCFSSSACDEKQGWRMTDLSIVIISWKMRAMLRELLCSIARHTAGMNYELIVVDNNSKDGTAEMIRSDFPDAVLIENEVNRGVAPSRNQALRRGEGRAAPIPPPALKAK